MLNTSCDTPVVHENSRWTSKPKRFSCSNLIRVLFWADSFITKQRNGAVASFCILNCRLSFRYHFGLNWLARWDMEYRMFSFIPTQTKTWTFSSEVLLEKLGCWKFSCQKVSTRGFLYDKTYTFSENSLCPKMANNRRNC